MSDWCPKCTQYSVSAGGCGCKCANEQSASEREAMKWNETETVAVPYELRACKVGTLPGRLATPADVLAAIMANRELREAVERAADSNMEAAFRAEAAAHHAALEERDDWKAKWERSLDALREAERERDVLGSLAAGYEEKFKLHMDEIAKLERELAEARAGLVREIAARWPEAIGVHARIAHLEHELSEAKDMAEFRKTELGRWVARHDEQAATIARMKLALTGSEGA